MHSSHVDVAGLAAVVARLAAVALIGLSGVAAQERWERDWALNNRRDHALAYNAQTRLVILFGGTDRNEAFADTWAWDGSSWTARTPAVRPGARHGHAMVYDASRQRVVLFGGRQGLHSLNDTWEWDGRVWQPVRAANAPPPRYNHALAFDARRGKVVLFGGEPGFHDTWEYDGNDWVQVRTPNGPPPRRGHAMAYDAARGVTVLFGGREIGGGYGQATWLYDGVDWRAVLPGLPGAAPPGRREHVMVYNPDLGAVVLFGGYYYSNGVDHWLNDLWAWTGAGWTRIGPGAAPAPRGRYYHAAAYDRARGRLVVFGGSYGNTNVLLLSDTWRFAFEEPRWLGGRSESPSARRDHAMSYDTKQRQVLLFGGDDGEDPYRSFKDDTWVWDSVRWRELAATVRPSGRRDHALVYDGAREEHLLFGGDDGRRRLGDTWVFRNDTWTAVKDAVGPPPRSRHAMVYMSGTGRTLLFGGYDGLVKLGDTWEWDGHLWHPVTPPRSPPRRSRHAMAYDRRRGRVVLFGGKGAREVKLGDTWEWDGARWIERSEAGAAAPAPRSGHRMVYDALLRRVVLFGGEDATGRLSDTWAWDGNAWTRLAPATRPSVRTRHELVYNAARQRAVLFGGLGKVKHVSDTWSLFPVRLRARPPEVSLGGRVTFDVDMPTEAQMSYICALALNRAPGVPLPVASGPVVLPLRPDYLTLAGLYLDGFTGRLDARGRAACSFTLGRDRDLIGLKFFACALTYDEHLTLRAVSNEAPVVITN